jgi:DNA adenine methylase
MLTPEAAAHFGLDRSSPPATLVDASRAEHDVHVVGDVGIAAGGVARAGDMNRYPGGKNAPGVWQWIVGLMPTHAVYVEACVGSGAVLRRKVPALRSVAIDSNPEIAAYWRRRKFPGLEVVAGDCLEFLTTHAAGMNADWLVYIDPPYRLDTRTKKRLYAEEWPAAKHRQLLELITTLPARVIVSGYSTPEYSLMLGGWHREEKWVMTRGGTKRKEVLWCNFNPGEHDTRGEWDARAIGGNYRERDRIRKKFRRWRRLFAAMPEHERDAFLMHLIQMRQAALLAAEGDGRST